MNKQQPAVTGASTSDSGETGRGWKRKESGGGEGALLELIGAAGRRDTEAGLWRGCESPPRLRHEQKPGEAPV